MAILKHMNGERVPINDTIAEGLVELAKYCKSRDSCEDCPFAVAPYICITNNDCDEIIEAIETGTRTTDDPPKDKQVFIKYRTVEKAGSSVTIYGVTDVEETEDFFVIRKKDGISYYRRDNIEILAFGAFFSPID